VTRFIALMVMNLDTPKAAAEQYIMLNKCDQIHSNDCFAFGHT
jgi:hypothetical protein